nr:chalcone--flavonone isomerase [Tanacetum cinerariifolium]
MAKLHSSTGIELESVFVPPSFKPPSATKTLFLIGAGVRQLQLQGTIQKVAVSGLYLEEKAIESLAMKSIMKSYREDDLRNLPRFPESNADLERMPSTISLSWTVCNLVNLQN